jgi:hypothetical protein
MASKNLKAYKTKGRPYWWLIEAHREGGRLLQTKLKYWGVNKPGGGYHHILMSLDDEKPLDDLSLVWRTKTGAWHWQRRGDFKYWLNRGQEKYFWDSFYNRVRSLWGEGVKRVWITRSPNRNEAIKNVKEGRAKEILESHLTILRLTSAVSPQAFW